jgi:DNA-directed RNA polymerase subunit RPC12/RpoP
MKTQYLFRNFYKCYRCNEEWEDVWSATCDDDCPHCGARHCSPYKSEDEEESF